MIDMTPAPRPPTHHHSQLLCWIMPLFSELCQNCTDINRMSLMAQQYRICLQCKRQRLGKSLCWKIPWRRKWQSALVFLPGKSHGQSSLADYSPWCRKKIGQDLATKQQLLSGFKISLSRKDMYTPVFTVALFIIATIRKQPKCPSTEEWIKMRYLYTMECKWKWSCSVVSNSLWPCGL